MTKNQKLETKHSATDKIRVLHLIDSLALGGAERMAVNLCNALAQAGCEAHLCATRLSGPMAGFINPDVQFLELKKRSTLDVAAIFRLRNYIRQHGIQIVHAHSSSFFMGCLMKSLTGVRLVWHDHYGDSEKLKDRRAGIMQQLSRSFDWVFSVNELLRCWAVESLNVNSDKVLYLQNFPSLDKTAPLQNELPGIRAKRIVCTARLHKQKDHMTLILAMAIVNQSEPDAHLLLVGQDLEDDYSRSLKKLIRELHLDPHVHLLGGRTDIAAILSECTVGVLSSASEGLPVSLLEYGLAGLAVVCTDVGECSHVLQEGKFGKVVTAKAPENLAQAMIEVLQNRTQRESFAKSYHAHVEEHYSARGVAARIFKVYMKLIQNG